MGKQSCVQSLQMVGDRRLLTQIQHRLRDGEDTVCKICNKPDYEQVSRVLEWLKNCLTAPARRGQIAVIPGRKEKRSLTQSMCVALLERFLSNEIKCEGLFNVMNLQDQGLA